MNILHFPSPNFSKRKRATINMIVIHCTAGRFPGSLHWMANKKSKVSCHYAISKKGEIFQMVADDRVAWHAGRSSWKGEKSLNSVSIGIELEHLNTKEDNYTAKQIKSLSSVVKVLIKKYQIPKSRILGHYHIAPRRKTDPIHFPWDKFFNMVYLKKKKAKPKQMNVETDRGPFLFRFFNRIALFFKGR